MSIMEGDDDFGDIPPPSSFGKLDFNDDENGSSTCRSSEEFYDKRQLGREKGAIALPQFKSKRNAHPSHLDSYQIYNLFNPTRGIRDELTRKGIIPHDHLKENVAAIALNSAKLHASKEAHPRIAQSIEGFPVDGKKLHQLAANALASRHRVFEVTNQGHMQSDLRDTTDSASIVTEKKSKKYTEKVDYMARNISGLVSVAAVGRKKRVAKVPEVPANEKNFGKIPPYLLRRKLELALTKEQRAQEERERQLPPGLVLMKDEERLEVLKTLEENKEKLIVKLRGLPLVVETPSQIRAKMEVDSQLKEAEESIRRFSRPKVYIRYTNN